MKLFDIFRLCFSFCMASIAHYYSRIAAYEFRGYESLGGEMFVFPMVLLGCYAVIGGIRWLVKEYEERMQARI